MTVNHDVPSSPSVPASGGPRPIIRRVLGVVTKFWSKQETLLPRPLGWWRAL